jgi:hypothetical protein
MPEPTNSVISIGGITLETKEIKFVGRIECNVLNEKMSLSLNVYLYSGDIIELKHKDIMITKVNDIVSIVEKFREAREQIISTRWPQVQIKTVDLT